MRNVILRLLGIWSEQAGRIVKIGFGYHGDVPLWLAILLGLGLAVLVFWMYQRTAVSLTAFRRWSLSLLRSAALCLLLLILIHPILAVTTAGSIRQTLLVLIDSSKSMEIADLRVDDADATRAGIAKGALDARKGLDQKPDKASAAATKRIDIVKAALKNKQINLLPRLDRDFDVAVYSFDRDVHELAIPQPKEQQPTTSPGELLVSVLVVLGLAGIVVGAGLACFMKPRLTGLCVTGGCLITFIICVVLLGYLERKRETSNRGTEDVAYKADWINNLAANGNQTAIGDALRDAILRKRGQPVAGVLLITDGGNNAGSLPTEAARMAHDENLPILSYGVGITSPRDIIVGSLFAQDVTFAKDEVPVTVRVRGQGLKGEKALVVLKLGDDKVDQAEITFTDDNEQVVAMKFTPAKVGDFELTASVDPRPDEVVKDNNSAGRHMRVIDGRIKVLVLDQLPRWEFKYLQAQLLRDRRVDAKFLLFDAPPELADLPNSPYIKQFPSTAEDLAKYDLIVLGDVDPHRLSSIQLDFINDFVSRLGGSMIMIAGKSFAPSAYKGSAIERMLPVEFETTKRSASATADLPIKLELTSLGKTVPMMRLADTDTENAAKWAALPPIYWEATVTRAKPAAEVLVVDPDPAKASRLGKMPVIAVQQYGRGSVMFCGTDNTWRWRKNTGDVDHQRLWGQILERMALLHLLGASKHTQLSTDRENYSTGDRVTIYARLYDAKFNAVTETTVKGVYSQIPGGAPREVILRSLPDQPGMYRGEVVAPAAGNYQFNVESDPKTLLDFKVTEQNIELGETALNVDLLQQMARESAGRLLREEDLNQLPELVKSTAQQQLSTFEVEFCYSPLYFMLLIGILAAEWTLRKLVQLK